MHRPIIVTTSPCFSVLNQIHDRGKRQAIPNPVNLIDLLGDDAECQNLSDPSKPTVHKQRVVTSDDEDE